MPEHLGISDLTQIIKSFPSAYIADITGENLKGSVNFKPFGQILTGIRMCIPAVCERTLPTP